MCMLMIDTVQLQLIAATHKILLSDINGDIPLSKVLGATIPSQWPPTLSTGLWRSQYITRWLGELASASGWQAWYLILKEKQVLIGAIWFARVGNGVRDELWMELSTEYQGQHYGREALMGFIDWAFENREDPHISFSTAPGNIRSVEKAMQGTQYRLKCDEEDVRTGTIHAVVIKETV